MAVIATRLLSDGTMLLNGEFDEYTYAGNAEFAARLNSASSVITGEFNEVTYNVSDPVIKNLLTYTQDFTNAAWANYQQFANSVIITGNVVAAPDNSITASKFASNNAGASFYSFYRSSGVIAANTDYVFSTYFKAGERTTGSMTLFTDLGGNNSIFFNLTTGAITGTTVVDSALTMSGNIVSAGDNWYRIWYTFRRTSQSNGQFKYQLDSGNISVGQGYYVWGAQHELGTTPTIYQPIAAANVLVNTGMRQRVDNTGNQYVSAIFDEFTGAPVVDSDLVLWLDAGQTTSYPGTGNVWTDLSGAGNNGTLTGGVTYDPAVGGSLLFDQISGNVNCGNISLSTSALSVVAWVYDTDTSGGYRDIVTKGGTFKFRIDNNGEGGNLSCFVWIAGNPEPRRSTAWTKNVWAMVAFTWNTDGNFRLFVNGDLRTSSTTRSGTLNNINNLTVGADGSGNRWKGNISDVMVYARTLTDDEIAQNFNALRRRYGI